MEVLEDQECRRKRCKDINNNFRHKIDVTSLTHLFNSVRPVLTHKYLYSCNHPDSDDRVHVFHINDGVVLTESR